MAKHTIPEKVLRDFEPQKSWLAHDSYLHGVGHMARVFILQELICDGLEAKGVVVDRTVTRYAAMAHDVGRVDDGEDLGHGARSAAWMKQYLADKMTTEQLDAATYCVHWHVPPDSEAPVMTTELMVLKDADGLDRVRLGDLDASYLRTDVAKTLIGTAMELYRLSSKVGGEAETFKGVVAAAKHLGLI